MRGMEIEPKREKRAGGRRIVFPLPLAVVLTQKHKHARLATSSSQLNTFRQANIWERSLRSQKPSVVGRNKKEWLNFECFERLVRPHGLDLHTQSCLACEYSTHHGQLVSETISMNTNGFSLLMVAEVR